MKSFQSIAILAALSGLQLLSGSQAQAVSSSAGVSSAKPAATATTTGGVVTPSPPTFINTPGLRVNSPYDNMQVSQNAFLSISASLQNGQALGTVVISVAQADGSNNRTIVNLVSSNTVALAQTWNISSSIYPVGNYLMNMIVTPNNTTPAVPPTTPSGSPSVYYWQARIKVRAPPSPVPTSGAESHLSGSSLKNTMLATVVASALVLGSALLL